MFRLFTNTSLTPEPWSIVLRCQSRAKLHIIITLIDPMLTGAIALDIQVVISQIKNSTGGPWLARIWAGAKLVQAKLVLMKLCTSSFVKLRASEILITCYPRIGLYLKICASEFRTSEIPANKGPPVYVFSFKSML